MAGVEQVLLIVKTYAVNGKLPLCRSWKHKDNQKEYKDQVPLLHNMNSLICCKDT